MRPIHLIVVGRNTQPWTATNMVGITSQDYRGPWRCTWIDDASTDGTAGMALSFARRSNIDIKVLHNEIRQGGMANLYNAIHASDDSEVIVHWDADDFFMGCSALSTIARAYEDPETWMTYGSYLRWPSFEEGIKGPYSRDVITHNAFRTATWLCEPPRSFLTGLFKHLLPQDLQTDEGKWIETAWDFAMYMPLMELAGEHLKHISVPMYLYNESNPLSDWCTRAEEQYQQGEATRRRAWKQPLERL
jgi:glycosyltransferase involved in cell wall biosynthesis